MRHLLALRFLLTRKCVCFGIAVLEYVSSGTRTVPRAYGVLDVSNVCSC